MILILEQKISRELQDSIFFLSLSFVVSKDHMQKKCKIQVAISWKNDDVSSRTKDCSWISV